MHGVANLTDKVMGVVNGSIGLKVLTDHEDAAM